MATPPQELVLEKVANLIEFVERIGYRDDAAKLREFHLQFSEKAPTRKELAGEFRSLREKLFIHMRMNAFDNFFDPSERDMPLIADYKRVFGEAAELLMTTRTNPLL